ncbi:hypothetical protein ACFE04_014912 [Oxalis oulophora]
MTPGAHLSLHNPSFLCLYCWKLEANDEETHVLPCLTIDESLAYFSKAEFSFENIKGQLHTVNINLSSKAMRHDAWNLHLLCTVNGPISPIRSRCNLFVCRSVLMPGGGNGIPVLKSATVVLTRSYDVLCRSPVLHKLIPAVCLVAFGAWGLGPLLRFGRAVIFHKSENSWKKSRTHYILTSYLQPLLLWAGTILICRSLDPINLPSEASLLVKQRLLNFVRPLSTVLAFAYCLSNLVQHAQNFYVETNESSDAKKMGFSFAGKAIYTAVWVAAVSLFMELLGFSTQRWLTAGGLGTVLLTLAGREIFTNFLSSVMIHATRPFVLNEWIQTKIEGYEVSGTVEHVGWWSPTIIRGDDREAIHIPNHKFSVNIVRNLTQKTHWRIKTHLAISHLDVHKINNIVADMRKVLAKNPQVEQQRLHRRVFFDSVDPESQALKIFMSCFVKTAHFEEYLCVKETVLLDLLRVISHHRARLATPIRRFQKIYTEADVDNSPFADTSFTGSRASVDRPYLLIEPSYRIRNDDKVKASPESDDKTKSFSQVQTEPNLTTDPKVDNKAGSTPNVNSKTDKPMEAPSSTPHSTMQGNAKDKQEHTADKSRSNEVESGSEKTFSKKEAERPVTSLEENIVLGVALDGSKRTLPIEEEEIQLAANRNSPSSSGSNVNEKKDGKTQVSGGSDQ